MTSINLIEMINKNIIFQIKMFFIAIEIGFKRGFLHVGEFYLDCSSLAKIKLTRGLKLLRITTKRFKSPWQSRIRFSLG